MLNLYKFYDHPEDLEQREYAPVKLDYGSLDVFIKKLEELLYREDVPEQYQLIKRVFGRPETYDTMVYTSGGECYLYPVGNSYKSSYNIHVLLDQDNIIGYYTHFKKETKFYKERSKVDHEKQMDDLLTLGLTKLAEVEIND